MKPKQWLSQQDFDKIKMFQKNNFVYRKVAMDCVFHQDDKKSLKIYGDKYNCLGCNKSGSTESILPRLKLLLRNN